MSDATMVRGEHDLRRTAAAAVAAGEIHQLPSGLAGVKTGQNAAASGDPIALITTGQYTVTKAASLVFTNGCPLYWDHSANAAVLVPASDKDFFLGTCVGDAASADVTCVVNINVRPSYKIELGRNAIEDEFVTAIVKTVVGSTTVEVPDVKFRPGAAAMIFGATAEAQKVDLLSRQGFAVESNWIVELGFTIVDDGDAAAIDFNIGVANATHASDADSITESCFVHTDANVVNLLLESDDGTTEVAATDSTADYALNTPEHWVIDGRDTSDIQIYRNGVLMLGSSVFKLNAATGPLKLLAHLEKSSDDETATYIVNYLRVRTMESD